MEEKEKKEIWSITIGDNFELFTGRNYKGQSGCLLEADSNGGFCIVIYLDNITPEEIFMLRNYQIKVRVFKDASHLIVNMIKFEPDGSIFEMIFDPTLYSEEKQQLIFQSNMALLLGVDSNTNKIMTLGYFNIPKRMYVGLLGQYQEAKKIDDYSAKYNRWINDIESRYSIEQMWDMATYIGRMGEGKVE